MAIGGGDGSTKANAITVETLEDLLTADAGTYGKYIEVIQDIDPANEAWYPGYISPLNVKNHIFSTSHHKITGVVVKGDYIMGTTVSSTEGTMEVGFHNLEMLNWVFKDTHTGTSITNVHIFSAPSNTQWLYFTETEFSIKLVLASITRVIALSARVAATSTSFYLQFGANGGMAAPIEGGNTSSYTWLVGCNVVYDSCPETVMRYVGNSSAHIDTVSFVYKNCKKVKPFSGPPLIQNTNGVSMCNTFLNCTFGDNEASSYSCNGSRLHIVATDAPSGTLTSGSASTVIATTVDSTDPDFATTSIKSKDFLISCGFLP